MSTCPPLSTDHGHVHPDHPPYRGGHGQPGHRPTDTATAAVLLAERLTAAGPTPCQDPAVRERWWSLEQDQQELAIAACWPCPALDPCREYAVAARERWGIWGATRPAERARPR